MATGVKRHLRDMKLWKQDVGPIVPHVATEQVLSSLMLSKTEESAGRKTASVAAKFTSLLLIIITIRSCKRSLDIINKL